MEIETATTDSTVDGHVTFYGSQGYPVCGSVRSLTQTRIEFELFGPSIPMRPNEILRELRVVWGGQESSLNDVVVENVVRNGPGVVCQARFVNGESQTENEERQPSGRHIAVAAEEFHRMLNRWGRTLRIPVLFKEAVEDVRSFLAESWKSLQRTEVSLLSTMGSVQRETALENAAQEYALLASPTLDRLFKHFEEVASRLDPAQTMSARILCQTHWHPYLMTCTFMHRIYSKPLGYAGDYEMMNMIWRNRPEGETLFAKVLSAYILSQGPATSVRNRVREVNRLLMKEVMRVKTAGQTASIFSVGCGPAREIELLLASPLSNDTSFQLMDFNDETLSYTRMTLEGARQQHLRTASFEFTKRSVYQLIRDPSRTSEQRPQFDMIYSSGLYDYLNERIGTILNARLYEQLKPGGVLYVTNFDMSNPIRNMMEYTFEWQLIHRNGRQMESMIPPGVPAEHCSVWADHTGINIFLEIRKPAACK